MFTCFVIKQHIKAQETLVSAKVFSAGKIITTSFLLQWYDPPHEKLENFTKCNSQSGRIKQKMTFDFNCGLSQRTSQQIVRILRVHLKNSKQDCQTCLNKSSHPFRTGASELRRTNFFIKHIHGQFDV